MNPVLLAGLDGRPIRVPGTPVSGVGLTLTLILIFVTLATILYISSSVSLISSSSILTSASTSSGTPHRVTTPPIEIHRSYLWLIRPVRVKGDFIRVETVVIRIVHSGWFWRVGFDC